MYERNLSSTFFNSGGGPGISDFHLLANEVRARQRLARSAQPARKQVLRPPDLPAAPLPDKPRGEEPPAATGAVAAREALPPPVTTGAGVVEAMNADDDDVKTRPRSDNAHAALRPRAPCTMKTKMRRAGSDMCSPYTSTRNAGGNGAICCRRRPKSKDYRTAAGKYARLGGEPSNDRNFNPDVEATMLSAFGGDRKRDRGVSVSAIRSLYRERHEREKAKAMDEVRRWWRLGRSEAAPLAKAALAASILLASGINEGGNGREGRAPHAETSDTDDPLAPATESDWLLEFPDGGVGRNVVDDVKSMTGSKSSARQRRVAARQSAEDHRDDDESRYRIFDGLDWQQALKDPSYAEGVVRDIKQALRRGEPVKLRTRENHQQQRQDQSLSGPRTSRDCHLMLKTFYMRCVPVSFY